MVFRPLVQMNESMPRRTGLPHKFYREQFDKAVAEADRLYPQDRDMAYAGLAGSMIGLALALIGELEATDPSHDLRPVSS